MQMRNHPSQSRQTPSHGPFGPVGESVAHATMAHPRKNSPPSQKVRVRVLVHRAQFVRNNKCVHEVANVFHRVSVSDVSPLPQFSLFLVVRPEQRCQLVFVHPTEENVSYVILDGHASCCRTPGLQPRELSAFCCRNVFVHHVEFKPDEFEQVACAQHGCQRRGRRHTGIHDCHAPWNFLAAVEGFFLLYPIYQKVFFMSHVIKRVVDVLENAITRDVQMKALVLTQKSLKLVSTRVLVSYEGPHGWM